MTTIPNLNVVVQQGASALEAHNARLHSQDSSLPAAAQQPAKETEQQTTVREFGETDKSKLDRDSGTKGQTPGSERKKKKKKKKGAKAPGRLLDTIA